jgi:hypothetical protein
VFTTVISSISTLTDAEENEITVSFCESIASTSSVSLEALTCRISMLDATRRRLLAVMYKLSAWTSDNSVADSIQAADLSGSNAGYSLQVRLNGTLGGVTIVASFFDNSRRTLEVTPSGDDNTADGSTALPFGTIQAALDASVKGV